MSLHVLVVTATLYLWAGYTFIPLHRPWMAVAFVCWAIANVCMGMDAMQSR